MYRFQLEKYSGIVSRHTCPQCKQKRSFTKYIDKEGKITFPDYVGRCNRTEKCNYHFTPKDYFHNHPELNESFDMVRAKIAMPKPKEIKAISQIDPINIIRTLGFYSRNNLYKFFIKNFGEEQTESVFRKYQIGTSKHWDGATVFWQQDINGRIRTGKIMLYNPDTGKRVKQPHNHINWVHSVLKCQDYNLKQCFFGEHLLDKNPKQTVAIVESEKTALIAALYLPTLIWIATGGKQGMLKDENLKIFKGRKVLLFPDLGATQEWKAKLPIFRNLGIEAILSEYLENNATEQQKQEGRDIADFLLESNHPEAILYQMTTKNPDLKTLIKTFDLKLVNISEMSSAQKSVNKPRKNSIKI